VHGACCDEIESRCGEGNNYLHALDRYIVEMATKKGDPEKVEKLIESEQIWFDNGGSAEELLEAVRFGDMEAVETLYEKERFRYAYNQ